MIQSSISNGRIRQLMAFAVCGLAIGSLSGCGNSLSQVSGGVTIDGEPIAGGENVRATVYFYPEGGTGTPAIGLLDESGQYEISTGSQSGIQPGSYVVTISATEIIPAKQQGEAPTGRPITARKYADPRLSGFRVEVEPGSNTFDFDLEPVQRTRRRRS